MPLLVLLLVLFLVLGGVGLAVKGLVWLAILAGALFVVTAVVGAINRARIGRK